MSYNSRDRAAVQLLAQALSELELRVFWDRWYLPAGRPWQERLEAALVSCRAVMIALGPHGVGSWQQREQGVALDRQAREPSLPVIPVLLPAGRGERRGPVLSIHTSTAVARATAVEPR